MRGYTDEKGQVIGDAGQAIDEGGKTRLESTRRMSAEGRGAGIEGETYANEMSLLR